MDKTSLNLWSTQRIYISVKDIITIVQISDLTSSDWWKPFEII